jgi:hypothetical protein
MHGMRNEMKIILHQAEIKLVFVPQAQFFQKE